MPSDDFAIHADECPVVGDGMPISSLPDEVNSIADLDCDCWDEFDSSDDI